jgi:hypothetical protein
MLAFRPAFTRSASATSTEPETTKVDPYFTLASLVSRLRRGMKAA